MEKSKKSIIIISIIILIITILLLLLLINIYRYEEEILITQTEDEVDQSYTYIRELELVKEKEDYLIIKSSLNQYISAINQNSTSYYGYDTNNNYTIIVDKEIINTNIYNILSENYIKKNSINIENVRNFVYEIKEDCFYIPIKIYKKLETQNIKIYAIYGVIEDMDYNPITESYILLNIDEKNSTFSVEQLENKEQFNNIEIEEIVSIEEKENNIYESARLIDEDLIKDYFTTYKRLALGYPEIVYNNYLDEEYKTKKFNSVDNYKKYVEENKDAIESIDIEKYNVEEQDDYIQYIGIDQNEKYYIFNVNSITDYKIILDSYTIDIPQFINKYNNASDVQKVGYNIQKCIDAINDGDYLYVYDKLDNTFKTNNYNNKENFIKYIKNNLYKKNEIENVSTSNEGEMYIYNIDIKNAENYDERKNMTVIMKLGRNTDFTMSFNMK